MDAPAAVAIACDALVEYWRTHPKSAIARVVFFERTPERTLDIVDVVRARFPGATVRAGDHGEDTIVIIPLISSASSVEAPAPLAATAIIDVRPIVTGDRPPLIVPPPEPPPTIIAPFGLPTTTKHTSRLAFEKWHGACGGSPIPAGCTGVAFRFAQPPSTVTATIRVHASAIKNAWLDGKPLDDGRAYLSHGSHVLAVECGAGVFAALIEGMSGRNTELAKLRAVADGAVAAAATPSGSWTELAGSGASFAPVMTAVTSSIALPDWTAQHGVLLPEGTRFVRFVFPIVYGATL
jgi:hypothetical protein